jgi:hypothetical protein
MQLARLEKLDAAYVPFIQSIFCLLSGASHGVRELEDTYLGLVDQTATLDKLSSAPLPNAPSIEALKDSALAVSLPCSKRKLANT